MMDFSGNEGCNNVSRGIGRLAVRQRSYLPEHGTAERMAWASALPAGVAANRAFRQQAACHCVDFVPV
jgi:hypothetical protein